MQQSVSISKLCGCRARVPPGDDRAAMWTKIRGGLSWPVLAPEVVRAGNGDFLRGRLRDLDPGQRRVLFEYVANRRGGTIDDVRRNLDDLGWIPIIWDQGISLELCELHRRF